MGVIMKSRRSISAVGLAILLGVGASGCASQGAQDASNPEFNASESSQPSRSATSSEPTPRPSLSESSPAPSPERSTKSEAPSSEPARQQESASVRQARSLAEDYLDYSAFSRSGLIDQLEFEGFSTKDATAAVDGLDVDWREQAVQKAYDYLEYSSFSLSGLIDQLEFEGFTAEQATYGAEAAYGDSGGSGSGGGSASLQQAVAKAQDYLDYSSFSRSGLIDQLEFEGFSTQDATAAVDSLNVNWNEQAALKAQEYLDYSSFSRSGLIDQLVFEGFTQSQAQYGVSQVGL